ncbi:hypothetical protein ABZ915_39320 [Streptomyces sp. NPDC046915]|uniref:hypothetical protein n=1 Tax=Streptomyces sp. NPDC046915 TaxID=3155257 RepID=UPI00340A0256
MSEPDRRIWRPLTEGGDVLVLAVDFEPARGEASFTDLAPELARDGLRILEIRPGAVPRTSPAWDQTPEAYLTPWLDELGAAARKVHAVLGHCAGAGLASALTGRLADDGPRPVLVALDPEVPDASELRRAYTTAIDSLAPQLDQQAQAEAYAPASAPDADADAGTGGLGTLAASLDAAYRTACTTACAALGVPETFRRQLEHRFTSYLEYLVAAARGAATAPAEPGLTVLSGTSRAALPAPPRGHRHAGPGAALLADRTVADLVRTSLRRP